MLSLIRFSLGAKDVDFGITCITCFGGKIVVPEVMLSGQTLGTSSCDVPTTQLGDITR